MSTLHETDVYQLRNERDDHKHPDYGYFALVLLCLALGLVFSNAISTPAPVGSGITDEMRPIGP